MITDARVFEEEHVPQELEHRNQELNQLERALQPATEGRPAQTVLLFGPSGSGKTCLSKYMLQQLHQEVQEVNFHYIDCWMNYSRFSVLNEVLKGVNQAMDIHRRSTPKDELLKRLQEYDGPPYIVIVDEADRLEDFDVLYDLYNTRNITPILIANREEDLFAQFDQRLDSRYRSARRIRLEKYPLDELVAILRGRAKWGLREDAVDREQLVEIADAVAGDARRGIQSLGIAARIARDEGYDQITSEVVEKAIPEAKSEVRQKNLDKLSHHQHAIYEIISEEGEISPSDLYSIYQEEVDDPKSNRQVRNYLKKMRHYNLVVAEGEKRARTYRVVDD